MATFTSGSTYDTTNPADNLVKAGGIVLPTKSFTANVSQLLWNSRKTEEGGCPETLLCVKCNARFVDGEQIQGPTRRRGKQGEGLKPVRSVLNPNGYTKRYWHSDCANKFQGTSNTQTISDGSFAVKPGTQSGWQNGQTTPTTAPINEPPPISIPTPDATNTLPPVPNTGMPELDALLTAILTAVSSVYDPKIHTLEQVDTAQAAAIARIQTLTNEHTTNINALNGAIQALKESFANKVPVVINVTPTTTNPTTTTQVTIGLTHKTFPRLLRTMQSLELEQRNIWLAGPAGSGKTTAAKQLSQALFAGCQCPRCTDPAILAATGHAPHYYFCGAIANEYKLSGFYSANGIYMDTQFYHAWKYGGVFLFDEVDRSMQAALLAFNAALANGYCDFPEGRIMRHPDCYIIAAGNTWGMGGNAQYSGAANIDKAFLSRFPNKIAWDYDEELEHTISNNPAWVNAVQQVRARVFERGEQYVIDPRQSMAGSQMLRKGLLTPQEIVENVFGFMATSMESDMWSYIGAPLNDFINNYSALTN